MGGIREHIEYTVLMGAVACLHNAPAHHSEVVDIMAGIKKGYRFGRATGSGGKQDGAVFLIQCNPCLAWAGEQGPQDCAWPATQFFCIWQNKEVADLSFSYCLSEIRFAGEGKFYQIFCGTDISRLNPEFLQFCPVVGAVRVDLIPDKSMQGFVLAGACLIGRAITPLGMIKGIHDRLDRLGVVD